MIACHVQRRDAGAHTTTSTTAAARSSGSVGLSTGSGSSSGCCAAGLGLARGSAACKAAEGRLAVELWRSGNSNRLYKRRKVIRKQILRVEQNYTAPIPITVNQISVKAIVRTYNNV